MQEGDLIGGYLLELSKHQCSARRIWFGRQIQSNKKVIIGTSILKDKLKFANLSPISTEVSKANRQLSLPFHVFKGHLKNNEYLVQVKQYYQEENLRSWINKNKNKQKEVAGEVGYAKQTTLFQMIVEQIKKIYEHYFVIKDLKMQKILIGRERIRILGGWYHFQYDQDTNMIDLGAKELYSNSFFKQAILLTIRESIKIGIEIVVKRSLQFKYQKDWIDSFINSQIKDSNLKNRFTFLVQKYFQQQNNINNYTSNQIQIFQSINLKQFNVNDKQLSKLKIQNQQYYENESSIEKHEKLQIILPLRVINDDQKKITVSKWQSSFRFKTSKDIIDVMYTQRSMIEYLGVRVTDQRQRQSQSIIYTYDWLPQKIRENKSSVKQFYTFLSTERDEFVVSNGYLTNSIIQQPLKERIHQQNLEQVDKQQQLSSSHQIYQQSSFEYSQNVSSGEDEQIFQIELRPIKFYILDKEQLKSKMSNQQFYNKVERIDIQQLLKLQMQLFSLRELNNNCQSPEQDCKRLQLLGVQYFQQGNLLKAIESFRSALAKCQSFSKISDERKISLFYNFALYYQKIQRYQQSLIYCHQSLQQSIKHPRFINFTLQTLNLLVNLLTYSFGDYEEALYYIQQVKGQLQHTSSIEGARFFNTIGVIMLQLNNQLEAIEYFLIALKAYESIKDKNQEQIGLCQLNLSTAYSFAIKYRQSLQFLNRSGRRLNKSQLWRVQTFKTLVRLVRNFVRNDPEGKVKGQLLNFVNQQQLWEFSDFPRVLMIYFKQ